MTIEREKSKIVVTKTYAATSHIELKVRYATRYWWRN